MACLIGRTFRRLRRHCRRTVPNPQHIWDKRMAELKQQYKEWDIAISHV
eukprot:CAMPEP_0183776382 /NCGR_PEP_ID=MMETSP0739-20130205/46729_1 /TAXON_ID=385413 /ORGANISM="Thalassiosira miniscula, Strain CCMP1093" /LENGTH=48 /DNA_ID= /DNA_START= /DNA_END= /DNA_ORIENTATION=